jgi:hypothetical protein
MVAPHRGEGLVVFRKRSKECESTGKRSR